MQSSSPANFCAIRIGHYALRVNWTSQSRGQSNISGPLQEVRRRALR
jgi:hypothetical protein